MSANDVITYLSIDEIKVGVNIKNIRKAIDETKIKPLAESIITDGLLNPLVVIETIDPETDDEIIELVSGHRRLMAIRYIIANLDATWTMGDEDDDREHVLPVTLFSGDIAHAELVNAIENLEREDLNPPDIAEWCHRMITDGGLTQKDLAKSLRKPTAWVSQRLKFHKKASDLCKRAVCDDYLKSDDNPEGGAFLAFSTALKLALNFSPEEQDEIIKKHLKASEKLTAEKLEPKIDPDKSPKPGKKAKVSAMAAALVAAKTNKYPNAYGVYMGLRFTEGLTTEEELLELLACEDPFIYEDAEPEDVIED